MITAADDACSGTGQVECPTKYKDMDCCSKEKPCGQYQGDCDKNEECSYGLKCGKNNCGSGYDTIMDCCAICKHS